MFRASPTCYTGIHTIRGSIHCFSSINNTTRCGHRQTCQSSPACCQPSPVLLHCHHPTQGTVECLQAELRLVDRHKAEPRNAEITHLPEGPAAFGNDQPCMLKLHWGGNVEAARSNNGCLFCVTVRSLDGLRIQPVRNQDPTVRSGDQQTS